MSFIDIKREWNIHKILRQLSRQRVGIVLQPGNVWVIERAVTETDKTEAALRTCYMRGWIEPLQDAVPQTNLNEDGSLPSGSTHNRVGTLWKITDSGWSAIHRDHEWTLIGILIGAISILIAFFI